MTNPVARTRAERLASQPMREVAVATGFVSGTGLSVREIWARRELLGLLTRREIRARYKDSVLGLTWSLVRPLMQLAIYYVAIGKFLGASRSIADFHIYVFAGLTLWGLFTEIVVGGTGSIVGNAGIIRKIHLPREIFPLSAVGSALFNFAVQMGVLVVADLLIGHGIVWTVVWWALPLSIAVVLIWGTALALLLGALNVYLRDVQYLVEVAMMVGFWASPIVYSWSMVNSAVSGRLLGELYLMNPMTVAVLLFQKAMWAIGDATEINGVMVPDSADPTIYPANLEQRGLVMLAVGVLLLFVCQRVFDKLQRDFAQEI